MATYDAQNRKRAGYKSVITRDIQKVEDTIASGDSSQISALRDNITNYLGKVQQLDESILGLIPPADLETAMLEQSDYTLQISISVHKLNAALVVPPVPGATAKPLVRHGHGPEGAG